MNTFLPYSDFSESARCLDYRRLCKQRVETWQILQTLLGNSQGWRNHPAVRMWKGFEHDLVLYGIAMCMEWRRRGYKDNMLSRFEEYVLELPIPKISLPFTEDFHASHRSNLLRKDKNFYSKYGWTEPDDLPYVWPVGRSHE